MKKEYIQPAMLEVATTLLCQMLTASEDRRAKDVQSDLDDYFEWKNSGYGSSDNDR